MYQNRAHNTSRDCATNNMFPSFLNLVLVESYAIEQRDKVKEMSGFARFLKMVFLLQIK